MRRIISISAALAAFAALAVGSAHASTIDWTTWTSGTPGEPTGGSATGTTANGLTVTYSGELESLYPNYPSWTPTSSYVGGNVGNAPLSQAAFCNWTVVQARPRIRLRFPTL